MDSGRVADPHHFNADPDPSIHCNVGTDPTFHLNAGPDPDPAPHQSEANLQPLVYRPSRAPILAYTPTLYCKRPRLHFDFNADPDPAVHSNADPDLDPAC
jgi:hypothetical protein